MILVDIHDLGHVFIFDVGFFQARWRVQLICAMTSKRVVKRGHSMTASTASIVVIFIRQFLGIIRDSPIALDSCR